MDELPVNWPTQKRSRAGARAPPPPPPLTPVAQPPQPPVPPPPSIPNDVLIEILKRMPLKSLVRFTCVCKSWFALLTSPTFISTLANYNLKESQKFLLFKEPVDIHNKACHTMYSVYDSDTLLLEFELGSPFGRKFYVVSSADGLLCLFDFYCKNPSNAPLILWNPSINKHRIVRVPVRGTIEFTAGGFPKLAFGFGLDSSSGGCYKAVRLAYFSGGGGDSMGIILRAEVYILGVSGGQWINFGVVYLPHFITTIRWRGLCYNGMIHWICNVNVNLDSDTNDQVYRMMLTFKLGNGEFGEINLPKELVDKPNETLRVVVVPSDGKEVLGVVHNAKKVFSLWVMEEYAGKESWVKLFSVNLLSKVKNDMNALIFSDHEVGIQTLFDGWLYYKHNMLLLNNRENPLSEEIDFVDTYVESLFLVCQLK